MVAAQRRASAADVLRPTTLRAKGDSHTVTLLAGRDYWQVYSTQRRDASARILRTRRGSRSAACACWACSDWPDEIR